MINASPHDIVFQIQEGRAAEWLLVADTALPSPRDYVDPADRRRLTSSGYTVSARSIVVLSR
jgi:hypothetical protein